ncbi:MAG: hypothetical protein E7Z72_00960 [Methanocorpusculum parvum]|nr:hypothetical protein [Methanocorpusculum parvum]
MRKTTFVLLVIAALFAAGIVSPAVSAAGAADGAEIQKGYYVRIGEENLDFSSFSALGATYIAQANDNNAPNIRCMIDIENNLVSFKKDDPAVQSDVNGVEYFAGNYTQTAGYTFIHPPASCFVLPADSSFSLATRGEPLVNTEMTIRLTGNPGESYKVYVNGELLYYEDEDEITMPRDKRKPYVDITFTPTEAAIYDITADCTKSFIPDDDEKRESRHISISVNAKRQKVKITVELSDDAKAGYFASGDKLKLEGTIENIKYADPKIEAVYLYITGRNLNANGVSLDDKEAVVDEDVETFTQVKPRDFNQETGEWEYLWENTGEFEPGTYTIYVVTQPKGHLTALDTGITPGSTELYLSDRSIHVKFAEENGGTFAQGDILYSYWSARGSPKEVRWYIIGQNFLKTGIEEGFSVYTKDQKIGEDAPQGVWGFVYDRYFSRDMAAGNYYLVYQHPGKNGQFDVWPDYENTDFTSLNTCFGESSSLSGRPSDNCAEVLKQLIDNPLCDDYYAISSINIQAPKITIDQVANLEIGDKLKIKGTTNYAGDGMAVDGTEVEDHLSLRIDRLNFDIPEENTAMQLQIVDRVVPENIIPYEGERTFEFAEIDTATWFAGTYQATVTNIDTGFAESITFTVGGEGTVEDSSTLNVPSDPTAEPHETLDPLPPIDRYEDPTEPVAPKSPGFILAPLALGLAFILRRE